MDSFDRDVWCLLGLPLDALTLPQSVAQIRAAAASRTRCFVSTPNLNFLVTAGADAEFRESVIDSDLSLADGMPLVWLSRVLGLPIRERVAGSDVFEVLRRPSAPSGERAPAPRALRVFFFGGPEGAAEQACARLDGETGNLRCAGWHFPGFASVEAMSNDDVLAKINASGADFLVVSLGARKGQDWIFRNLPRLRVPVVSHLGAVVNFLAGSVSRAPEWMRRTGLEWLWRIKEEPALLGRYMRDGLAMLRLVLTRVAPSVAWRWWRQVQAGARRNVCVVVKVRAADANDDGTLPSRTTDTGCRVALAGALLTGHLEPVRQAFREAVAGGLDVTVDLNDVTDLDGAFLGLLMLLRKELRAAGHWLRIETASAKVRWLFRLNAAAYLLE